MPPSDSEVIHLENVWNIFGERSEGVMQAVRMQSLSKADVLERFGCAVGAADAPISVREGEIFCVMGLPGSGKSTLVRHINRLLEPSAGRILVHGEDGSLKSEPELRRLRSERMGMAMFALATLACLGVPGFREKAMTTVALLGTAACISITLGIPVGIICARSRRAYAVVRPVLDLMQTMPAFAYLIPAIAFFGSGKPAGVIATMIFGSPPVVRPTLLGPRGVNGARQAHAGKGRRACLVGLSLPQWRASPLSRKEHRVRLRVRATSIRVV